MPEESRIQCRYPTSGACPSACLKHNLKWHKQWNNVPVLQQLHPSEYATLCTCAVQSLQMQPCISLQHPLHPFNLVNQVISEVKVNATAWEKNRSGWAGMRWFVQVTAQGELSKCLEASGRHSYSFCWAFEYVHWDRWSVSKSDSYWNCKYWNLITKFQQSHVTFTFKQISYFLRSRFWNYQIAPRVQPYRSEHKGPDEHRNKESLDSHTNWSTTISLLFLPKLQILCSLWMATSASSFIADGQRMSMPRRAQASCLRCSRDAKLMMKKSLILWIFILKHHKCSKILHFLIKTLSAPCRAAKSLEHWVSAVRGWQWGEAGAAPARPCGRLQDTPEPGAKLLVPLGTCI